MMSQRVALYGKVKGPKRSEAEAKASVKSANFSRMTQTRNRVIYP